MGIQASKLIQLAKRHIGEQYVLGALAPKDNRKWKGPWDCAEFCSWLVYQTRGSLYGCNSNDGNPAIVDAYTGFWARDALKIGKRVSVDEAVSTPGAMLLREPAASRGGHIALSDGKGGTIEAHSTKRGVIAGKASGRPWDTGILVPGFDYRQSTAAPVYRPPRQEPLRLRQPNMSGPAVRELQCALKEAGVDSGPIDGEFGPFTLTAVLAYQRMKGLVPDGIVGPRTAHALGIQLSAS